MSESKEFLYQKPIRRYLDASQRTDGRPKTCVDMVIRIATVNLGLVIYGVRTR